MKELKFLCDAMLAGLGRRLRMAGYDTEIASGAHTDHELLLQACNEGRIFLTADRQVLERKAARDPRRVIYVAGNDEEKWAAFLSRELGVGWRLRPFTRCLECNKELRPLPPGNESRIPSWVDPALAVECQACRRAFWAGSHVRRMAAKLEELERKFGEKN